MVRVIETLGDKGADSMDACPNEVAFFAVCKVGNRNCTGHSDGVVGRDHRGDLLGAMCAWSDGRVPCLAG